MREREVEREKRILLFLSLSVLPDLNISYLLTAIYPTPWPPYILPSDLYISYPLTSIYPTPWPLYILSPDLYISYPLASIYPTPWLLYILPPDLCIYYLLTSIYPISWHLQSIYPTSWPLDWPPDLYISYPLASIYPTSWPLDWPPWWVRLTPWGKHLAKYRFEPRSQECFLAIRSINQTHRFLSNKSIN